MKLCVTTVAVGAIEAQSTVVTEFDDAGASVVGASSPPHAAVARRSASEIRPSIGRRYAITGRKLGQLGGRRDRTLIIWLLLGRHVVLLRRAAGRGRAGHLAATGARRLLPL